MTLLFYPNLKVPSGSPNKTHLHYKYVSVNVQYIYLFSKTASRFKIESPDQTPTETTNVKQMSSHSSSNGDIWFLFLLLEQNIFLNSHVVHTKVQMFNCMYFFIIFSRLILFLMNYESCRKVEALKSIMAHFKTKEKTCHRSFTTTIGNANFTTHLYRDIFL